MKIYLTEQDLPHINAALSRGADVRIQVTKEGYRILSDTVRVLKKSPEPEGETPPETLEMRKEETP